MGKLTGSFKNRNNDIIYVNIISDKIKSDMTIHNGDENGRYDIYFSDDPVNIDDETKDTFDTLLKHTASVNLVTRIYLGDYLFSDNLFATVVTIYKNTNCIFAGFVEPTAFTQSYDDEYESIELNCNDYLSVLENMNLATNVEGITSSLRYKNIKKEGAVWSFKQFINHIFSETSLFNNDGHTDKVKLLYDKSKKLPSNNVDIFTYCGVSNTLYIGETEDDLKQDDEILDDILKYFNLHVVQIGKTFYFFDWNTKKSLSSITWFDITNSTDNSETTTVSSVLLDASYQAEKSTKIDMSDVYNQITVTDSTTSIDDLIEAPLDDSNMISPYNGKTKYCTEYIGLGDGNSANDFINSAIHEGNVNKNNGKIFDWYLQTMIPKNWTFSYAGNNILNLVEYDSAHSNIAINEYSLPAYLKSHSCTPCIFNMGKVERQSNDQDNSITASSISMNKYLYISINGNESNDNPFPDENYLKTHSPIMEYSSDVAGVFTPPDDNTTNYIVFSGKMTLQPIIYESSSSSIKKTGTFYDGYVNGIKRTEHGSESNVIHDIPANPNEIYYTRKFYTNKYVNKDNNSYLKNVSSLAVYQEDYTPNKLQYNYTAKKNSKDLMSKLPILECEMKIGNSYCVETNADMYGNSTFEWLTWDEITSRSDLKYTDSDGNISYDHTFSLGVNPAIGDKIYGKEYDIQNTIDYTMNVNTTGTAIPIKRSDSLSGNLSFKILGPINTVWNDVTRRHRTWFKKEKWSTNQKSILANTENIIISDFTCKMYTDGAGYSTTQNNDIVYQSAEGNKYLSKKDDITFNINTALTSDEAMSIGVEQTVNLSSVVNMTDNTTIHDIIDTTQNITSVPEKLYVDAYYKEYSSPKLIVTTKIKDNNINYWNKYKFNYFNKTFYPIAMSFDVINNSREIKFKEI